MNRWASIKPSLRSLSSRTTRARSSLRPRILAPALSTVSLSPFRHQQQEIRALHTFHTPDEKPPSVAAPGIDRPFTKLLAANRGEISCRINRAAAELGIQTAGIYSREGRFLSYEDESIMM